MNTSDKKKDIASKIKNIAGEFVQFCDSEFPEYSVDFEEKVLGNVIALLNVEKPKVMVYGIYNSGKSTLINALCKEKVAEMADRPMTDQITEYDRGDYYLVDSPGVDAPIQHEMVTEEYLDKCHIILYVISSKGLFEDKGNYERLAGLIKKEIPFIIVLNDRGDIKKKEWTEEEKKRAEVEHERELKVIQYKIIDNLVKVSNDKSLVDKYEVVIINARKAWMGVIKNMPQLYENSRINFLNRRINQLLTNEAAVGTVFKQPIFNLKSCINEVEKLITQTMSGNLSEDFAMRLHTFERKKDNIMEELKILTLQAVNSHMDELTNSYVSGDADIFETIANMIFMDVDDRYEAKLKELLVFVERNFKNLNLYIDGMSNLYFDLNGKTGSELKYEEGDAKLFGEAPKREKHIWDFLKTRKRRERERREQLELEARLQNEKTQYILQENIRRKQEARQLASSDLDVLYRELIMSVTQGLNEKYDDLITQIQQIDCLNKEVQEKGNCQMEIIRKFRKELNVIENEIS